jgi:hypothetical protein
MKFKNLAGIAAKLIAIVMLVGATGRHPYGYYSIVRWVVCGVSAFAAFKAAESKKSGWTWALAMIALIFNPIMPVYLKRSTWVPIDLGVAAVLLVSVFAVDRQTSSTVRRE